MGALGRTLLVLIAFVLLALARRSARIYGLRKARAIAPRATHDDVTLVLFVSAHCRVCPAQKSVVAEVQGMFPNLRVTTIDAELDPDRARELAIMTVPSTVVRAADGTVAHVNGGFVALEALARQVEELMRT